MTSLKDRLKSTTVKDWKLRPEVLLAPQLPKPMHRLAPRTCFGSRWWDQTRQAVYASTDYHCVACGVAKAAAPYRPLIEAHELYDTDYERGRLTYLETVPLCIACHEFIHVGRLQWLMETGKITQARYVASATHGERVLAKAGLRKPKPPADDDCTGWADWRLVIDGRLLPEWPLPPGCPPFDVRVGRRKTLTRALNWNQLTPGGRRRYGEQLVRGTILGGERCWLEFPPLFKDYDAWLKFHRGDE